MRLHLPGTFTNKYEGRFAQVSSRRVWKWTPLTTAAYLALSYGLLLCHFNPVFALMAVVLISTTIILACMFFIPVRVAYPLQWLAAGSGFAIAGASLLWWIIGIALFPEVNNKFEISLLLGFWGGAFLLVGSSSVTAILLGFFGESPAA